MRSPAPSLLPTAALAATLLLAACGDDPLTIPEIAQIQDLPLPTLEVDATGFDALGPNRVAFWRVHPTEPGGLYVIDGAARTTSSHLGGSSIADPRVSPDGTRLAFHMYTDTETWWDVYVSDLNGAAPRRLSDGEYNFESPPAWSPDSRDVLYTAPGASIAEVLAVAAPADGGGRRTLALLDRGRGPEGRLSLSVQGELAVSWWGGIAAGDLDATAEVYTAEGLDRILDVDYAPDGGTLAVLIGERLGGPNGLDDVRVLLLDPETGGTTILTRLPVPAGAGEWGPHVRNASLCWTRDGTRIVFSAPVGGGPGHAVYVAPAGGGVPTPLTAPGGDTGDLGVSCF